VPHNFIRIDPYKPISTTDREKPKPERRKPEDADRACKGHDGIFECLLFDTDTKPQSAFVQFKNGDVNAIIKELGGGQLISQYFDSGEMKPDTP
jgi:hypothetical protein